MGEHFRRPAGHGHVAHDDCIIAYNDVFDKWFGIAYRDGIRARLEAGETVTSPSGGPITLPLTRLRRAKSAEPHN